MQPHLLALSGYRPPGVVSNEKLVVGTDLNAEWITRRTGVESRRHTNEDVTEMAISAAAEVLRISGLHPGEIDMVIVATESSAVQSPPSAGLIAYEVGSGGAGAVNINNACSGFCYALADAAAKVASGEHKTVLVVASEQTSQWLDPTDLDTAFIFGDGAGAAVVVGAQQPTIWPSAMFSDGSKSDLIGMKQGSWLEALAANPPEIPTLAMNGMGVFRWVIENSPSIIENALRKAGKTLDEIDVFIPHQANLRIVQEIAKRLGFLDKVLADDVKSVGNTSSASIPLAATALLSTGRAKPGQTALFFGFGAGMTAAAQVVELPAAFSLIEG